MKKVHVAALLAVIALIFPAIPASAAPMYSIQDLRIGGGSETRATAINDTGSVVGHFVNGDGIKKPFLYSGRQMQELSPPVGNNHYATDINNSGTIVGRNGDGFSMPNRSWVYNRGAYTLVPDRYEMAGGLSGINNSGVAVGEGFDASYDLIPIVYRDGEVQQLATFGTAEDINDRQQSVGSTWMYADSDPYACVWPTSDPNDLNTIDIPYSYAMGINENDQAVGYYSRINENRSNAFLWNLETDETLDLGHLGGDEATALKINDAGQIVGHSETIDGEQHAFLYIDGEMYDLNDLITDAQGWDHLSVATDVNELGQIVGQGYYNGELHAFVLNPVPIPAPVLMMGAGLVGLMGLRRRILKNSP